MNETISLFDKYGGVPTITEVVRAFYKKVRLTSKNTLKI